jgi:Spy/CpxP family protein refolding chaperone
MIFDMNRLYSSYIFGTNFAVCMAMSFINHKHLPDSREVVMKNHLISRMVVVGAAVVLMGIGVNAFAGMGQGPGNPGMGGASANLTDDQIKKMESERNAFQSATKDIRQQLNEKRQALHTELAKPTPDAAKAATLQKAVSDLQSQFDQKRLIHILNMKKIDPNFVEGPGMGFGMGPGMGQGMGPGMGQGASGGGPKTTN